MAGPNKRFRIPTLQEIEKKDPTGEPSIKVPKVSQSENGSANNIPAAKTKDHMENISTVRVSADIRQSAGDSEKSPAVSNQETGGRKIASDEDAEEQLSTIPPAATKSSSSLIVNPRQRGNPILKSVRNITWEYGNIIPDYVMGQANCAIFLSLRYHQLHPNYIHERLKNLGRSYDLRVMLVQVDVKDPQFLLKDLAKICILADCTLVLAFSAEEAGRYLETYKIFENKPPEAIMEKTEEGFMSKFADCITKVKSVNKTDCATLISHFGSLSNIIEASEEDFSLCPGFGPQKAQRLHALFHEPFRRQISRDGPGKKLS
ncbi:DNA excision repair protein ERCC-1 [Aplysia californica]|uniref:DNA excision repair protein ERCC-1 n=1 Tax=Aplysia californica TaxID=6500 RepID=A0ABM0JEJ8_APLCA|nr:DNA excision repair protein ERCC-1 [Aplysia californica]